MIRRIFNRCLLRPGDLALSQEELKVMGAFNPGVVETPEGIRLLVRVAETAREERPGYIALPRRDAGARVVVDWLGENEVDFEDSRVVIIKRTGLKRLTFISHLVIARSPDGRSVDAVEPERFLPATEHEEFGVEDPRITPLEGRFFFTYVAVSRHGAATALASTADFKPLSGTGSFSRRRTRTWCCSRSGSADSLWRCIVPTRPSTFRRRKSGRRHRRI